MKILIEQDYFRSNEQKWQAIIFKKDILVVLNVVIIYFIPVCKDFPM